MLLRTTDRITVEEKVVEGDKKQGILTITGVIKEDESRYRCEAKNLANDKESIEDARAESILEVHSKSCRGDCDA